MPAYYNEIDPHAAQWLRKLIADGHIAPGDVDERSIVEVHPDDLRGYQQCHFFAGIGGWSYALRLAGIPDDRPVWTGSCPCQPFSTAGKQRGFADERHLWPAFFALIRECRPRTVLGEQVAAAGGVVWWDQVATDLEAAGYAAAAANLGAHSVGAPHIRQRLCWVAYADEEHDDGSRDIRQGWWPQPSNGSGHGTMANPMHTQRRKNDERSEPDGCHREDDGRQETFGFAGARRQVFDLADPESQRHEGRILRAPGRGPQERAEAGGAWDDLGWLQCSDGKARPTQPGIFPLVNGLSQGVVRGGDRSMAPDANQSAEARTMRLRGYGNAIIPQVAALFITAAMQSI